MSTTPPTVAVAVRPLNMMFAQTSVSSANRGSIMDELRKKVMDELDVLVTAARMLESGTLDEAAFERTHGDVVNNLTLMVTVSPGPGWTYSNDKPDRVAAPDKDDYSESKERWIAR